GGVEAFGKPAIDRSDEVAGFGAPAFLAPQPCEIASGAQLQRFCFLGSRDPDRLLKRGLALVELILGEQYRSGDDAVLHPTHARRWCELAASPPVPQPAPPSDRRATPSLRRGTPNRKGVRAQPISLPHRE